VDVRTSCVICTLPRSGSWLLAEALQSTGVAGRPEEYFRQDWLWRYAWHGRLEFEHLLDHWPPARAKGLTRPGPGEIDVGGFITQVRRIATTGNGVLGIKVHLQQLDDLVLDAHRAGVGGRSHEQMLSTWFPNPRYVLLTRRDLLRQAISHYRAVETRRWWAAGAWPADGDRPAPSPCGQPDAHRDQEHGPADLSQVEQFRSIAVRQEERWRSILAAAGAAVLELAYEDLAADPAAAVNAVLRHLGLPESPDPAPGSRLRRQADAVTEQTVRRYHAWRAQAAAVPWPAPAAAPARRRRRSMRTETLVVDNFYADPAAVREYALAQPYYYPYEWKADVESGRVAATWMASRFTPAKECPFKSSEELIAALERNTGERVDRDRWCADFPVDETGRPRRGFFSALDRSCLWNCSFHLKPDNGQKLGEGVHNHVVDGWNGVDINGWAGIIYLSPDAPLAGGLQLWRNRDPDHQFDWTSPAENWELVDSLGNVPNRLILCRGSIPHSGARGWGDNLGNGRLFQTFFFRTIRPVMSSSVEIPL
jgi:LPS sulfotransferase NodH